MNIKTLKNYWNNWDNYLSTFICQSGIIIQNGRNLEEDTTYECNNNIKLFPKEGARSANIFNGSLINPISRDNAGPYSINITDTSGHSNSIITPVNQCEPGNDYHIAMDGIISYTGENIENTALLLKERDIYDYEAFTDVILDSDYENEESLWFYNNNNEVFIYTDRIYTITSDTDVLSLIHDNTVGFNSKWQGINPLALEITLTITPTGDLIANIPDGLDLNLKLNSEGQLTVSSDYIVDAFIRDDNLILLFESTPLYPYNLINSRVPINLADTIRYDPIIQDYESILLNGEKIELHSNVGKNETIFGINIPAQDLLDFIDTDDEISFLYNSTEPGINVYVIGYFDNSESWRLSFNQLKNIDKRIFNNVDTVQIILTTTNDSNITADSIVTLMLKSNVNPLVDEEMPTTCKEVFINNIHLNEELDAVLYNIEDDRGNSVSITNGIDKNGVTSMTLDENNLSITFLSDIYDFNELTLKLDELFQNLKTNVKVKFGLLPGKIIQSRLENIEYELHDSYSYITFEFTKIQRTYYTHHNVTNFINNKFSVPNYQPQQADILIQGSGSNIQLAITDDNGTQRIGINLPFSSEVIIKSKTNQVIVDNVPINLNNLDYTSEFFELMGECTYTLNNGELIRVVI